MREQPYQVIDTLTNETVAWCTYVESLEYVGKPGYSVVYRPGRKKGTKQRRFP